MARKIFAPFKMLAAKPAAPAAAAPAVEAGIPGEVLAAISAAVSVICGDGAVVRGVRRVSKRAANSGRTAWSMAGLLDNTRAF